MVMMLVFALSLLLAQQTAPVPAGPLKVVAVSASSALPKWQGYTFDAANLIDGRVDTSWQPAKKDTMGVGQWVELDLGAPHEITKIEIAQGLQKVDAKLGDLFCRNNRFADARVFFDDGSYAPVWGEPAEKLVVVESFYRGEALPGKEVKVVTRFIRIVVRSVLEPVDWKDIAIAELRVFGRPAAAPPIDATSIAWDRPGAWPFKVAIIDYCAVGAELRRKRDCPGLVNAVSEGRAYADAAFHELPPIAVADRDKGEVLLAFAYDKAKFRIALRRGEDERWSVKALSRLDASGKPAEPAYETLSEPDDQHQNECWEKLAKRRACDESGEHVPDPDKVIEPPEGMEE